jgi:hypothetical protein
VLSALVPVRLGIDANVNVAEEDDARVLRHGLGSRGGDRRSWRRDAPWLLLALQ